MRFEESEEIAKILSDLNYKNYFKTCLNLGSGDIAQMSKSKPWVDKNVFAALSLERVKIIHVDAFRFPGVNLVQDLSLPDALNFVSTTDTPRLFILANVLEHIPAVAREGLINKIYSAMSIGDALLITVPYDYPFHADPIDTMYRPSPRELTSLAPLAWRVQLIVTSGSYKEEFKKMGILKKIRKLLKPLWIFQKISKWKESQRLCYLFKPYKVSVVFGIKEQSRCFQQRLALRRGADCSDRVLEGD